jgi:hypothetical protein
MAPPTCQTAMLTRVDPQCIRVILRLLAGVPCSLPLPAALPVPSTPPKASTPIGTPRDAQGWGEAMCTRLLKRAVESADAGARAMALEPHGRTSAHTVSAPGLGVNAQLRVHAFCNSLTLSGAAGALSAESETRRRALRGGSLRRTAGAGRPHLVARGPRRG